MNKKNEKSGRDLKNAQYNLKGQEIIKFIAKTTSSSTRGLSNGR